jgi:tRNA threonylcarbamoyladenosine biosynthesis protein TsaB
MIVLAVDTALAACAAAVFRLDAPAAEAAGAEAASPQPPSPSVTAQGELLAGETIASETMAMTRGHAEALLPMIERVMGAAKLEFADLDRIAVTVGPGSFTGLRVGISAARGLGLASGKPVVGITSLAALAAPMAADMGASPIISAIDARHGQVYFQVTGGRGTILIRPRAGAITEAAAASRFGACRIVGDAAQLVANAWPAGTAPPSEVRVQAVPEIEWVARLGASVDVRRSAARPLYLRPPDAKPQSSPLHLQS